jgi:metal-responsive CopG/Arc/MetJ family transcriptional regulator
MSVKKISVTIPEEVLKELIDMADGRSISSLVTKSLQEFLDKYKDQHKIFKKRVI